MQLAEALAWPRVTSRGRAQQQQEAHQRSVARKQQAAVAAPDGVHQEAPAGGEERVVHAAELHPGACGSSDARPSRCAVTRGDENGAAVAVACAAWDGGRQGLRFSPQDGLRRQQ